MEKNKSSEVHAQYDCCTRKIGLGTIFSRCGKKPDGLTVAQETHVQVAIEKGFHVIQSLMELRIVEQVRRGQRHGTSEDQKCSALMRDHFRRCTRKGVVDPINKQKKLHFDGCVDGWGKRRKTQKQTFIIGHAKEAAKLPRFSERKTRSLCRISSTTYLNIQEG